MNPTTSGSGYVRPTLPDPRPLGMLPGGGAGSVTIAPPNPPTALDRIHSQLCNRTELLGNLNARLTSALMRMGGGWPTTAEGRDRAEPEPSAIGAIEFQSAVLLAQLEDFTALMQRLDQLV